MNAAWRRVTLTAVALLTFHAATAATAQPRESYVPQPVPAQTDYQIGAFYYPGWDRTDAWDPIKRFYPERKPLLGWHHVGNPEVVDWQIKWAVEHGVRFFVYDWYWAKGHQRLEEGLHSGLFKARYQNLIKFCLLYANHKPFNTEDCYSPEEFEKTTEFWIANYFKRPNYLTVDGKPVLIMFSPTELRHLGKDKVKPVLDRMRQQCREAGLPGVYLCGTCGCPSQPSHLAWHRKFLESMRDEGYDAVTAYGWSNANMTPAERTTLRSPYSACIEGYRQGWNDLADLLDAGATNESTSLLRDRSTSTGRAGGNSLLKLIPPLAGGWDCRPWSGDSAIARTDRTPEQFKKHLLDCKAFLDTREQAPKLKMAIVGAWNEWCEGSYIEPEVTNRFGHLEAIRQVFAPHSPKPADVVPSTVGLGPYDLPEYPATTVWDFTHAKTTLGWGSYLGRLRVADGALRFAVRTYGPIPTSTGVSIAAADYPFFVIRAKVSRDVPARLYWGSPSFGLPSYRNMLKQTPEGKDRTFVEIPLRAAPQAQEVKIRLADTPSWRDTITVLQLLVGVEPGKYEGVDVAIESMQFTRQ